MTAAALTPTFGTLPGGCSSIAFGNGIFMAVGGQMSYTSTDGLNWSTGHPLPIDNYSGGWGYCTFGNGVFAILRPNPANPPATYTCASSNDGGVTWTKGNTVAASWIGLCYGNGVFISFSTSGSFNSLAMARSTTNGVSYTALAQSLAIFAMAYGGNNTFVGVGNNVAWVSTDGGVSFVSHAIANAGKLIAIAHGSYQDTGTGVYLAITSGGGLLTSPDGVTWTGLGGSLKGLVTIQMISNGVGSAIFHDYQFVAIYNGTGAGVAEEIILQSNTAWSVTYITMIAITAVGIAYGNGVFVELGSNPNITQIVTNGL
jgi:hypothetical protein